MFKEVIYHRPKNNYAYAYDSETVHIRLKAKKGDLINAYLIYGDPYQWTDEGWVNFTKPMTLEGTDDYLIIGLLKLNQNTGVYDMDSKFTLKMKE